MNPNMKVYTQIQRRQSVSKYQKILIFKERQQETQLIHEILITGGYVTRASAKRNL